jgi:hypothetical protein
MINIDEPDFNSVEKSISGKETINLLKTTGSEFGYGNTSNSRMMRISRNTNGFNMTKVITDNPKVGKMRILENYQRELDHKLAKPK